MKAYEVPAQITAEGKIELPEGFLELLPRERAVRVIILVNETSDFEEDNSWSSLTEAQFLAGYSEADSVYDTID